MNETMVYADGYSRTFAEQEEFFGFLKQMGGKSHWERKRSKDLWLVAFTDGDSEIAKKLREEYEREGLDLGILSDTMEGTSLLLKAKDRYYPVRSCAIKTILDRAGISGTGLRRLDKNVYARILNDCLKTAKGESLLRISEGKVSAVHGGDCYDYAILDMEQIFHHVVEYLQKEFPGSDFTGGFYDHTRASALWELSRQDELLGAYCAKLEDCGYEPEEMKPALRVTTSDVGVGGANLYPMLLYGPRQNGIPLGEPIRLNHEGGATMEVFDKQLDLLFGKYQAALNGLARLATVTVNHPGNCMIGVMKKVKIAKKYITEAVNLFEAQNGPGSCTALDIYYGMSEVMFMMTCEGEPGGRIADVEEKVARALALNWKEFDVPGEIKW
ncbi:transposase [Hungatella effluvii]|uniref:transposase n=1 Tax=Hungatella effluvii TaxID=1096246 RepID=UPI002A8109B8|nr:transposase [Hungatella effluvii]